MSVAPKVHSSQQSSSLSGLLLGSHLSVWLLLLEESPGFVSLLLEVLLVADELDRVDDLFVIEEHTSNFSSGVTILGLNVSVNKVSDLLTSVAGVHVHEALQVNGRHLLLLLLHHLLLHDVGLIRCHSLGWHRVLRLAGLLLLLLLRSLLVALATLAAVVVSTSVVVVLAVITLTLVVSVVVLTVTVLTLTLSLVAPVLEVTLSVASTHLTTCHKLQVFHEVLLNLLEAALLALLVQLLCRHPELNAESAGTEGRGLIKALNGLLGAVDVFVKDKVLSVGGVWVKVFALSQFD